MYFGSKQHKLDDFFLKIEVNPKAEQWPKWALGLT